MPGPFPGMDPYLERAGIWQGFHNSFIAYLNEALNLALPDRFLARSEMRVYIDQAPPVRAVPDVSVFAVARGTDGPRAAIAAHPRPISSPLEIVLETRREAFLEILDRANGNRIVMVIELLSPENKRGAGREEYRRKQQAVLESSAHLVEIDLLRGGSATVFAPSIEGDRGYRVSLADFRRPWSAFLWRVDLREPLPVLSLPLTDDSGPVTVDPQAVFDRCYDAGRYAAVLDDAYSGPTEPPLSADDALWAQERLRLIRSESP